MRQVISQLATLSYSLLLSLSHFNLRCILYTVCTPNCVGMEGGGTALSLSSSVGSYALTPKINKNSWKQLDDPENIN